MDPAKLPKEPLLGMGMDLPQDERDANDMTKTGKFCPKDGEELEKVSEENRYTCHYCGGIFQLGKEGGIEAGWFDGFE